MVNPWMWGAQVKIFGEFPADFLYPSCLRRIRFSSCPVPLQVPDDHASFAIGNPFGELP